MAIALMYHDVVAPGAEDASGFPGRDAALYKVTRERFQEHLRGITALAQPAERRPVLTFDDGGVSALEAADLLESFGFRGRFFVTAGYVGSAGFLSAAQLRHLHARGHVVGSHSCSHPLRMGHCSAEQLDREWRVSVDVLSQIVGSPIAIASVPGGDFAPRVARAAAEAGIRLLFTSEPTSAVVHAHGLELRGRYTIYASTSATTVTALARGDWLPHARQAAGWSARKAAKRLGGSYYLTIRKMLLRHGDDVRWGDAPAARGSTAVREG